MSTTSRATRGLTSIAVAAVIGAAGLAVTTASGNTAAQPRATGPRLTILAAASLSKVFPQIDKTPRYTFAGSGMLATQIQQGAPADVFASASPKQTDTLYAAGLVEKPIRFATNTLVMIVPKDNPKHIKSVDDIVKPGVKIVVCNATVPCGMYASTAFANLGITDAATKNIVSQQTDVTQVVAQIAAGQGDVGFVYITDARAAKGRVRPIGLPDKAKPFTVDTIAIVRSTKNRPAAAAFVRAVLSKRGQKILAAAAFGKP
jgi:molybdate transport system substrate-binding protein